jgi:hypothetical protein
VDVLRQTLADPRGVFDYVIVDGSHYFSSSDVSLFAHLGSSLRWPARQCCW